MNFPCGDVVNPPLAEAEKTIVILGQPRSGTSILAGVVRALGVPLSLSWPDGQAKEYEYHEDERINAALRAGDDTALARVVEENNAAHPVWAYKHIFGLSRLGMALPLLRNPYYLVTTRGLAAIVQRQRVWRQDVSWQALWCEESAGTGYTIEFVAHCRRPLWVGSFDRMLRDPAGLVREVVSFCGLIPNDEQMAAAMGTVKRR